MCLEMLCDDRTRKFAVKINCGCKKSRVWHAECFRTYAHSAHSEKTETTIICPAKSHTIQIANGDDPLKNHRLINLGIKSRTVLRSNGESGKELRIKRKEQRIELRAQNSELKAMKVRSEKSDRGMQNFVTAFYSTLLPKVLGEFSVDRYNLRWYPVVNDFMGMGYYGDIGDEWRSPQAPGAHGSPPSSAKVQLRVQFENPGRDSMVDWDAFRAALRSRLGCLCSMPWKYKMATFLVPDHEQVSDTDDKVDTDYEDDTDGEGVGLGIHSAVEGERQIHETETWVLNLDLTDIITRCKKSGLSNPHDVMTQIRLIEVEKDPKFHARDRQSAEKSLGEATEKVDGIHTCYVTIYSDDDDEEEDDYWWSSQVQWADFREVEGNLEALERARITSDGQLAPVFDIFKNFKEEYINIAGSALTHLTTYLNQHIQTYLSSTPFQPGFLGPSSQGHYEKEGIEVEVVACLPGGPRLRGTISRGHIPGQVPGERDILHDITIFLISEFEQGNWRAKIFISHLQSDYLWGHGRPSMATLVEDATAWDHCVWGFQNQLHNNNRQTGFGVSYRGRKGHEVVVKTITQDPQDPQDDHTLEILLFWRNDSMTGVQMRPGYLLRNVEEVP